jgi:hypothetical protein
MLKRTPAPQRQERDWFQFSSGLMHSLCSDYIAVRLLYSLEPLTTAMTILPKMLDVVEKALKLHLAVQTQTPTALADARAGYGHNLEKLRAACAQYEPAFDHPDIQALTKDLNDKDGKLYQHMRYGSQETTIGWQTNLVLLLPVVDRVFAHSLLLLPAPHRQFLLFCSSLKNLVTRSRFDQTRNPDQLIELLARENPFFGEFVTVFEALDREHEELSAQLQTAAEGKPPPACAEANPSIERTVSGKPETAAHVDR